MSSKNDSEPGVTASETVSVVRSEAEGPADEEDYFGGAGGAKGCGSRVLALGSITKSRCACCTTLSPMAWSAVCSSGRF